MTWTPLQPHLSLIVLGLIVLALYVWARAIPRPVRARIGSFGFWEGVFYGVAIGLHVVALWMYVYRTGWVS